MFQCYCPKWLRTVVVPLMFSVIGASVSKPLSSDLNMNFVCLSVYLSVCLSVCNGGPSTYRKSLPALRSVYKSSHSWILHALLLLQLLSFGANFCCPATMHSCRIIISYAQEKNFCPSATTRPECFSPDRSSAVLLPQLQNVSHRARPYVYVYVGIVRRYAYRKSKRSL